MSTKPKAWEVNAAKFAALDSGEGWPFAVLVACSVEKDNGNGNRYARTGSLKVSASVFAEMAGTSHQRVLRYLDAWDRAAKAGDVPEASSLAPDDVPTVVLPTTPWKGSRMGVSHAAAGRAPSRKPIRPTPEQLTRRREWVVGQKAAGASAVQIAEAAGISESAIYADLNAMGVELTGRVPSSLPVNPEPFDWRTEPTTTRRPPTPPTRVTPLYTRSETLRVWGDVVTRMVEGNHVNMLAHDATDAEHAHDVAWFEDAERKLNAAQAYLARLRAVVTDSEARCRGRSFEERDDMPLRPPALRSVGKAG